MNFLFKHGERLGHLDRPGLPYVIFGIALIVRVAGVFLSHQYADLERYELERTALSLAQTGVYGNPYAIPTGPSAHVSPGYTLILAALFWAFGTGVKAEIVKQIFASAVSAFQCALIVPVAKRLRLDFRAAFFAAVFCTFLPTKFSTETMGDWEAPYTAIALMLLSVLMVRAYSDAKFDLRNAGVVGVSWGLGILFASVLLPVFGVMLALGLFLGGRNKLGAYLKFCAVACFVALLCISPWIIRNYLALGSPVASRTNLGLELRVSNNDQAGPDEHDNYLRFVYHRYHPLQNPAEARKVRTLGEVGYNRMELADALQWIQTHRQRFAELTGARIALYWFYIGGPRTAFERTKYLGLALIHLLGLIGVIRLFKVNRITAAVLAVILGVEPLPHYLVHVGPRHSYDIDWILTLSAAMVFVAAIDFLRTRAQRERNSLQAGLLAAASGGAYNRYGE
jgi:hypothetical protein